MKKFLFFVLFVLSSCSVLKNLPQNSQKQEEKFNVSKEFVQGSEDIPLLSSMEKIADETLGFDSDSGSVMASSYKTDESLKSVKSFYLQTLPQLGWEIYQNDEKVTKFRRENENLEIELVNEEVKSVIRFYISSSL